MSRSLEVADMSRFWRLVSAGQGRVSGTWWVSAPNRGVTHIRSVDVTLWLGSDGDVRHWGRTCSDHITAFVENGQVTHLHARDRESEVRAVADDLNDVLLAVASIVEWPEAEVEGVES